MAGFVRRPGLEAAIRAALRRSLVVALHGPRQCGKTTLARRVAGARGATYFDLEDPVAEARLEEPMTALSGLRGLVVIDEVQRAPHLFPVLRVLADRVPARARFLLLGSASPELMRGASETLAGRVQFIEMSGFELSDVGERAAERLWLRGGFPRAFLARSDAESMQWREAFVRTFLERDVPSLGFTIPAPALRRLWAMLAHYHGQVWNASEIGRSLGEAHTTVRRHLDILTAALVVRQLEPWFENLGKRQVKSPKVYVRDCGLLHALLGARTRSELEAHPKVGASWEGFVIEQAIAVAGERNAHFWATQSGAELDLLVSLRGRRYGVEVKRADAPRLTKSMAIALQDLRLEELFVVYPRGEEYALGERARAIGLPALLERLRRIAGRLR